MYSIIQFGIFIILHLWLNCAFGQNYPPPPPGYNGNNRFPFGNHNNNRHSIQRLPFPPPPPGRPGFSPNLNNNRAPLPPPPWQNPEPYNCDIVKYLESQDSCRTANSYHPVPGSCTNFIRCFQPKNGRLNQLEQACPGGRIFSVFTNQCEDVNGRVELFNNCPQISCEKPGSKSPGSDVTDYNLPAPPIKQDNPVKPSWMIPYCIEDPEELEFGPVQRCIPRPGTQPISPGANNNGITFPDQNPGIEPTTSKSRFPHPEYPSPPTQNPYSTNTEAYYIRGQKPGEQFGSSSVQGYTTLKPNYEEQELSASINKDNEKTYQNEGKYSTTEGVKIYSSTATHHQGPEISDYEYGESKEQQQSSQQAFQHSSATSPIRNLSTIILLGVVMLLQLIIFSA